MTASAAAIAAARTPTHRVFLLTLVNSPIGPKAGHAPPERAARSRKLPKIQDRRGPVPPPEGGRSHKVHLRSAGNLPEVLRFAQDDTLLVLLSQRHPFNKGRPDFRSRVDLRGTMA